MRASLIEDDFVVIMSRDHPAAAREMTLALYVSLAHLKVAASAVGTNMIDDALRRRGLSRNVVMTVPSWLGVRRTVEGTDLVSVIPRHWSSDASFMARCVCRPLPLDDVRFTVEQVWHARDDDDSAHAWLRQAVAVQLGTTRAGGVATRR